MINDSYIQRKPLEFTLIVLVIILLTLTPVYVYLKFFAKEKEEVKLITESFEEVNFNFVAESEISEADKKINFRINYKNNVVQWRGIFLKCEEIGRSFYQVNVQHKDSSVPDVIFTTSENCLNKFPTSTITYKMTLVDWRDPTFIGKDGEILS